MGILSIEVHTHTPGYQSGLEDWLRILDVCVVQGVGQHLDRTSEIEDISASVEEDRNIVHFLVRGSHCEGLIDFRGKTLK